MLDVGYERKLASGNKLRKSLCRCHRSAAAAINVILRAAKNQRRNFYFRRIAKGVPGTPRLVMIAMLLRARLSLPQGIRQRADDFRMLSVESFTERHVRVLDVTTDEAFEAVLANLFFIGVAHLAGSAVGCLHSGACRHDRQGCDQVGPFDGDSLNNLTAERKSRRMNSGDFQLLKKPGAVFSELADGVAMIRFAAVASAATIENDRAVAPRQKRHDIDFPSVAWPPGRRRQQNDLAFSRILVINLHIV